MFVTVCPRLVSVLLSIAELYWRSSCHTIALPVLLQALALAREYSLQYLASETVLNLAFSQVGLIRVFTGLQGNIYSGDLDAVFTPVRFKNTTLLELNY